MWAIPYCSQRRLYWRASAQTSPVCMGSGPGLLAEFRGHQHLWGLNQSSTERNQRTSRLPDTNRQTRQAMQPCSL